MKDAKPNLSSAAIKSNIEYFTAQQEKYNNQYKSAEQQRIYWTNKLKQLEDNTQKGE